MVVRFASCKLAKIMSTPFARCHSDISNPFIAQNRMRQQGTMNPRPLAPRGNRSKKSMSKIVAANDALQTKCCFIRTHFMNKREMRSNESTHIFFVFNVML